MASARPCLLAVLLLSSGIGASWLRTAESSAGEAPSVGPHAATGSPTTVRKAP